MTEHLQNHYDIKVTVECVGCARVIGSYHHSGGARRSYNKHKQSCERYKLLLQQPTSDEVIDNEARNNSNDEAETSSSKEATRVKLFLNCTQRDMKKRPTFKMIVEELEKE